MLCEEDIAHLLTFFNLVEVIDDYSYEKVEHKHASNDHEGKEEE
jgi:hypothetical protein